MHFPVFKLSLNTCNKGTLCIHATKSLSNAFKPLLSGRSRTTPKIFIIFFYVELFPQAKDLSIYI